MSTLIAVSIFWRNNSSGPYNVSFESTAKNKKLLSPQNTSNLEKRKLDLGKLRVCQHVEKKVCTLYENYHDNYYRFELNI